METPLVPQVLLQHGQFVRTLARSLLRDAHAAEDVAQEAWARTCEARPEERGLRAWLRVVTRNLAVNRVRGERGRAARERAAARPEALPSAHDELEHAELLGVVVQAVLALDEPYRETIVARYYRGLDAEALAARSGTTAATVRSREHRALEKLREALDRRYKGERGVWAAMLARIAGPLASEPAGRPAFPWVAGLTVAVPVLAVVAGAVYWRGRSTAETSLAAPATSTAVGPPAVAAAEPAALAPAAAPAERRAPLGGSSSSLALESDPSLAEIHGRFTLPGGVPAARVPIKFHGWRRNQDSEMQFGVPMDWVDPQVETDDDGRLTLRFAPPRAFQFMLDAKAPGHAEAAWRWSEILAGTTLDLGEVELPVGGTIEGRMVDAQGNALLGEVWKIYARTDGLGEDEGRDETQVFAVVDRDTASFRLEHVWPWRVQLSADSDLAGGIDGPAVAVRTGETTTADIVYSGPSNARRITVTTSCRPFYTHNSAAPAHVRLIGPGGETRVSQGEGRSSQSHSFDDLAPGVYTLEIDDPRFLPWSRAGVAPGEGVHARLVGSAALCLSVIDARGEAVERYAVRLTLLNAYGGPTEFELHDGATPLASGLLRGIPPGDCKVAVRCPDGATARCEVKGLASGETRAVRLELGLQRFAAGRVVHADGEGVADVEVMLLTPAPKDDSDASAIMPLGGTSNVDELYRQEIATTRTGAEGVFRIDATTAGPFMLRARADGSHVFSAQFTLEPSRADLELLLPTPGTVRGRVRAPAGVELDGLGLWIAPRSLWEVDAGFGPAGLQRIQYISDSASSAMAILGADGSFELERLPPGPSRAFLVIVEVVKHGFQLTERGIAGATELGDLEVPAGGVLERDFEAQDFPGSIVLTLRVNGQPAPFVELTLRGDEELGWTDLEGHTDAKGVFGPIRATAGEWTVFAQDRQAGWDGWIETPILVEPGRQTRVTLDAEVPSGMLLCVDVDGRPLARQSVAVMHAPDPADRGGAGWSPLSRRETDADGRLELRLMPGEYVLQREPFDPRTKSEGGSRFTWTSSGPLVERVQL